MVKKNLETCFERVFFSYLSFHFIDIVPGSQHTHWTCRLIPVFPRLPARHLPLLIKRAYSLPKATHVLPPSFELNGKLTTDAGTGSRRPSMYQTPPTTYFLLLHHLNTPLPHPFHSLRTLLFPSQTETRKVGKENMLLVP